MTYLDVDDVRWRIADAAAFCVAEGTVVSVAEPDAA